MNTPLPRSVIRGRRMVMILLAVSTLVGAAAVVIALVLLVPALVEAMT